MIATRLATPRARVVSAFLAGALSVAGFAPWSFAILPPLSLALLFVLWRKAATAKACAQIGLAYGLGLFLFGVSWVYVSLSEFGGMPPPVAALATLLFCSYLALYPALAGALFGRWQHAEETSRNALLFAGLWIVSEWLRGWMFTGFPWLAVGYSQSPPSPLAGWASVIGVYGVGLALALIAALLGSIFLSPQRRIGAVVAIIVVLSAGHVLRAMDWTQAVGTPIRVNLLQGNVPQSLKWDPRRLSLSIDTYLRLAQSGEASQLTVLPETSLPLFLDQVPEDVLRGLTTRGDALIGIAAHASDGGYTNSAVAVTPALQFSAYAKHHLVPFGEYAPPGFAWFFKLAQIPMSDFSAGAKQQAPLELAGQKVAPNICYEDVFGEELIAALPAATLLVNLSNTAWFGDSLAQPQHLQIARLRALETGRTILRATNTGITAMITPGGEVAAALPPFTMGVLRVEAQGYSGMTPFAKWGNALAMLMALGCCLPAWKHRNQQNGIRSAS